MPTDAELDAEEAELQARIEEADAALRAAKARLRQISQERLILHKEDHQIAYDKAKASIPNSIAELKGFIATSNDPQQLRDAARKVADEGYKLSDLFHKAHAGEERQWESPATKSMESLQSQAQDQAHTAEVLAEYLWAAERSTGNHKKLFADTAASIRRNGAGYDDGGMPCTNCGEPKWGYNDETYECRSCY